MSNALKLAAAMGILLLAVALLFPPLADSVNNDATATYNLSTNNSQELTDKLELELDKTGQKLANDNATITYRSLNDLNTTTATLNESTRQNLTLNNDEITATVTNVSSDAATIETTYDPMFGFNTGARTFFEEIDTLLIALGIAAIIGLFAGVARLL